MYTTGPYELPKSGIEAATIEKLAEIAVASLKGKRKLAMVCGPLTTGGTNDPICNFQIFNSVVRALERRGRQLFNQLAYEVSLRGFDEQWKVAGNEGYYLPILDVFYAGIFKTGAISEGLFIPGWHTSTGARWERSILSQMGVKITDLTRSQIKTFLTAEYPLKQVRVLMRRLPVNL